MRDFTNVKIGHWTIVGFHHKTSKHDFWNAKCICGKETVLRGDVIKKQRSNSCHGCTMRGKPSRSRLSNREQVLFNTKYSIYKSTAKSDDRKFELSKAEFTILITSKCHYCLTAPNTLMKDQFSDTAILIHGVDRIDSSIGYTTQNCVSCCAVCNYMKNDSSIQAFKVHVAKIHANSANF